MVSPDRLNATWRRPLSFPDIEEARWDHRVPLLFDGVRANSAPTSLRAVSKERLRRYLGVLDPITARRLSSSLQSLFAD